MERNKTIDEYIAVEMADKIGRRAKSPLLGLLFMAVGIGFLVLLHTQKMSDTLMASCLTLGIITLGVGIIITAMCLTKAIWHYVYKPTKSNMRRRKCYLSTNDYQHCLECIGNNDIGALATLLPVNSSNSVLELLYSKDKAIVLMQAMRDNSGHFEPETPVIRLTGNETNTIVHLCK